MQTMPAEPVGQVAQKGGSNAHLEPDLQRIESEVLALGQMVAKALLESVQALRQRVAEGSETLIALDHLVTRKRFVVESDCLSLIVAQQPWDGDLRAVAAMLEIVAELEHIGKYITDIAQVHLLLVKVDDALLDLLDDVDLMAAKTQDMLHRALVAFIQQNVALARAVHADDHAVDVVYRQAYGHMLAFMTGKSRALVKQARYLAQIARNLERAADRVTNICEWVIFANTGKLTHLAGEPAELDALLQNIP